MKASPGEDFLPLSALQHLLFCERQCALIHIEGLWAENALTAEGRRLHDRVDEQGAESRGGLRIARGLLLFSKTLRLSGKADVVEFHRLEDSSQRGIQLSGSSGRWAPFPVEYKRGRPKANRCDEVQLCAQALCLEEMLAINVPAGALFYGQPRRRTDVAFDKELRKLTQETTRRLHELLQSGRTPKAARESKCDSCSLLPLCLPGSNTPGRSAAAYLRTALDPGQPT